jgi:FixJ family two-component response regulator
MNQIILIDDDENLLNSLGDLLEIAADVRSLRFKGLSELIAKKSEVCRPESILAIVDINLEAGEPNGLDVYRWLRGSEFKGEIIFLTGHAKDHPAVQQASMVGDAQVFEKPMNVDELLAHVERLSRVTRAG